MQPTDPNKFTEKAWQAIVHTPDLVKAHGQQQIETEHLLKALLEEDGLAVSIFNRAGVDVSKLRERTEDYIRKNPRVSGSNTSVYLGRSLDSLLDRAEAERQRFGDQFISIEHLILGYCHDERFGKPLFQEFNLDEKKLRDTIQQIRGHQTRLTKILKTNTKP